MKTTIFLVVCFLVLWAVTSYAFTANGTYEVTQDMHIQVVVSSPNVTITDEATGADYQCTITQGLLLSTVNCQSLQLNFDIANGGRIGDLKLEPLFVFDSCDGFSPQPACCSAEGGCK